MDKKEFDKFLLKTMKEHNPRLKIAKKIGAPKKRTQESASLPEGALGMAILNKDTTKKKD